VSRSARRQRVDDIDGSAAAHTVAFALDGLRYEIDLSDGNAAALREVFAPYIAAGRKAGSRRGATAAKAKAAAAAPRSGRGKAAKPAAASGADDDSAAPTGGQASGEESAARPEAVVPAAEDTTPPEETTLAAVVPLPRRPGAPGEARLGEHRRRLVADVGELTRVAAVALLAATADRLVARIVKPVKATNNGGRVRKEAPHASIAPAG
jgi:hypothetical protein